MNDKSGAPSFYKTIMLYLNKGWNVHLILDDASNGGSKIVDKNHLHVLKPISTDKLISEKLYSKIFQLNKMYRYNKFAIKKTREIMKSLQGDTLFYAYEINGVKAASICAKKYNKPLITRFQGTVITYMKWTVWNRIKYSYMINALRQKADMVIMTDDGTKGLETLKRLGNTSSNIKFWRNGVDLLQQMEKHDFVDEMFKKNQGLCSTDITLLTVSRLQDWKRVDRAIKVLSCLSDEYKLIIVGDGPERPNLEQLAKDLNVEHRVLFKGALSHEEVYQYIANVDFFLSLYDMSNVGNPLLEALTLGKCIITLDVGDTNKIIYDEYNGFIFNPDNMSKIPNKIKFLSKNTTIKRQIEENAYKYARENLTTWEKRMAAEYEAVVNLIK